MAESSLWGERGDALCRGRGRLEEVPLTERCQAIDVLAMAAMEEALAFARGLRAVQAHVRAGRVV